MYKTPKTNSIKIRDKIVQPILVNYCVSQPPWTVAKIQILFLCILHHSFCTIQLYEQLRDLSRYTYSSVVHIAQRNVRYENDFDRLSDQEHSATGNNHGQIHSANFKKRVWSQNWFPTFDLMQQEFQVRQPTAAFRLTSAYTLRSDKT